MSSGSDSDGDDRISRQQAASESPPSIAAASEDQMKQSKNGNVQHVVQLVVILNFGREKMEKHSDVCF